MRIDGVSTGGGGATWADIIMTNVNVWADVSIALDVEFDYLTMDGMVTVDIIPEAGFSGAYNLHVLTIENNLVYRQLSDGVYIDPFTHMNVMRGMFPVPEGEEINIVESDTTSASIAIEIMDPVNPANVQIVAFLQDTTSQTVLNAARLDLAEVVPITVPNLAIESVDLVLADTDGDGKWNRGESTELGVNVSNACDWFDATDVTAYLSTTSPYVTIDDSIGAIGDIAQCDLSSNLADLFMASLSEDAPLVDEIPFLLRLMANSTSEYPYEVVREFQITLDMFQLNYPVEFDNASGQGTAVLDLDGDGQKDIILGDAGGLVHAISGAGNELPGFPVNVNEGVLGSPAVADIDNDGDIEIVVGSRNNNLYVIQHDGTAEAVVTANGYLMATPSLADLDDDGDYEIIAPGYGNDIQVVHHDGSPFGASPLYVDPERMVRGAAVAHINDHTLWVIVVSTQSGNLHVLDMLGDELAGFPVSLGAGSQSDVSVADLDGDGNLEILVGADNTSLHCVSFTGEILWTHQNGIAPVRSSPAIVDLVANGGLEVAFISMDGQLWVLDAAGALVDGWPQSVGSFSLSSPVAADIDNDGTPELFAGSDDEYLYGFYADGTPVEGFPVFADNMIKTVPTVADLDGDGNLELIAGTSAGLTAIDIKTDAGSAATWFTDQGSYLRDGVFPQGATLVDPGVVLPRELSLSPNYPNPFNPDTRVSYGLPEAGMARIAVYDVLGREVIELTHEFQSAGWYDLVWQGVDEVGREVATGVYYMKLDFGTENRLIKMLLMK